MVIHSHKLQVHINQIPTKPLKTKQDELFYELESSTCKHC